MYLKGKASHLFVNDFGILTVFYWKFYLFFEGLRRHREPIFHDDVATSSFEGETFYAGKEYDTCYNQNESMESRIGDWRT